MRTARRVWLALLCFFCAVGPLAAQEEGDDIARARANFQQAVELEQAGNCAAALPLFRQVGQVRMTPQVRFHIGLCEAQLGRLVTALGGLELALADADTVGQGFRDEVEQNIARLRERIPKLVLRRGAGAEAASIELDGVPLGDTSIGVEVPVDPGPHSITARARGYESFEQTVNLREGATETLQIELEALPAPPPDAQSAAPGAPPPPRTKVLPYVIGGAGVASLVASGVLFALRQSSLSELDSQCENDVCPSSQKAEYDRLKIYHYGSIATLGVGVAALGTAATLFILDRKASKEQAKVTVLPTLLPSVAAATVRVRF